MKTITNIIFVIFKMAMALTAIATLFVGIYAVNFWMLLASVLMLAWPSYSLYIYLKEVAVKRQAVREQAAKLPYLDFKNKV
jgi:hypothetical protein